MGGKKPLQMPNIFPVKSCVSLFSFELRWSLHPDLSSERKLRMEKRLKSRGWGQKIKVMTGGGQERRQKGRSVRGKRKRNKKNLVCNVIKWFAINWPNASGISWLEPIKNIYFLKDIREWELWLIPEDKSRVGATSPPSLAARWTEKMSVDHLVYLTPVLLWSRAG